MVLAGDKAYVSNWGGRRPDNNSVTGPAGRGTLVRVDPVRHIASEGSVTVIESGPESRRPSEFRNPRTQVRNPDGAARLRDGPSPNGR